VNTIKYCVLSSYNTLSLCIVYCALCILCILCIVYCLFYIVREDDSSVCRSADDRSRRVSTEDGVKEDDVFDVGGDDDGDDDDDDGGGDEPRSPTVTSSTRARRLSEHDSSKSRKPIPNYSSLFIFSPTSRCPAFCFSHCRPILLPYAIQLLLQLGK